jgi:hypothetical protein
MKKYLLLLIGISFLTFLSCDKEETEFGAHITLRSVSDDSATFELSALITNDEQVYNVGVAYGHYPNPDIYTAYQFAGTGSGNFMVTIKYLTPDSTYYARPYAHSSGASTFYAEQISFKTLETPYVPTIGGPGPGGGIVFYLDGNGGGMEVDDVSWASSWGCEGLSIPNLNPLDGFGLANTDTILHYCQDANIAAKLCSDYNGGGFSDWYLPSFEELLLIYNVVFEPGYLSIPVSIYHASNEQGANSSMGIHFMSGSTTISNKDSFGPRALPVRTF